MEIYREYYNCIEPYEFLLGTEKFIVISNELIHLRPEAELKWLCAFIGIKFMPQIILNSTFLGVPWKGNSAFGPIETFDSSLRSSRNWLEQLDKRELIVIDWLMLPMIRRYGMPSERVAAKKSQLIFAILYCLLFLEFVKRRRSIGMARAISLQFGSILMLMARIFAERSLHLSFARKNLSKAL